MIDYTLPLARLPDPLPIAPITRPFHVTIVPPGSKSITNRLYLLAALAEGTSRIARPLRADDCDRLLDALVTLGARAEWRGGDVLITGAGGRFPRGGAVNLGDGGTPTRFMIAAACLAAEPVVVDGSPRMRERPIAEGVQMLRALGARIEYVRADGRLPVRVEPGGLRGGALTVGRTASSQFISAVLLVAPFLEEGVDVRLSEDATSRSYVELTAAVLRRCGVVLDGFTVMPPARGVGAFSLPVEPDASSALYWMAAAAVVPGSSVLVPGLDLHAGGQPDARAAGSLERLGPNPSRQRVDGAPAARFEGAVRAGGTIDAEQWPDGALAAAVMAACAPAPVRITGLHTLRVKETDRIAALAAELRRVGCTVEATDDSITIDAATRHDEPAVIETYNDHRMAMAFAVLGLARSGLSIRDPRCVAKSYPGFWRDLARLYGV